MSEYQVIARKWRPQCFADVVGQEHVVRTLRNAISSGRIAHAYLFVGPRGIGKTTLARIFAKALNCESPVNGEPCCKCASCLDVSAERSLDVMEIDAASRNSTGDMRELADNTLTRPVNGRYKIYIIDEVHMLSKQAWNVLLKTVEEPPSHVKFIFATTEVHQVLPTIISRCQRFDLMPIPTRLIAQRLKLIADTEKVAINPQAVNAIARAAEGGMRDAQSLLDQMIAFFAAGDGSQITEEQVLSLFGLTDKGDLETILRAILQNRPADVVTGISRLSGKGKNLETLFDDLLQALRAVQLCSILADPSELLDESAETIERYRNLAQSVPRDTIQILLENIAPVGRVLHDALNKQVFVETILLKAMREAHAVRIGDILARLNQLRSAGELKFLEQLPAVEKNIIPAEQIPQNPSISADKADVAAEESPVINVESADIDNKNAAEEEVLPNESEQEESGVISGEAEGIDKAYTVQEEDPADTEPVVELPDPAAAISVDETSELEAKVDYQIAESEIGFKQTGDVIFEEDMDVQNDADETSYHDDEEDILPMDLPSPEYSSSVHAEKKPSYTPDKFQKSIANENPQALNTIAGENPAVQEMLDLFSGTVIDIHR